MRGLWILPLAVVAGTFLALTWARGYPWQLALMAALAIGALIYVTQRTIQNMRSLARPDRTPTVVWTPEAPAADGAPGEGDHRGGQQQVGGAPQSPTGKEQNHPRREQQTSEMESSSGRHDQASESQS